MSTINKGNGILTLINVFTADPDAQLKLVSLLIEATEKAMRHS
jgi:hypothetical protein